MAKNLRNKLEFLATLVIVGAAFLVFVRWVLPYAGLITLALWAIGILAVIVFGLFLLITGP